MEVPPPNKVTDVQLLREVLEVLEEQGSKRSGGLWHIIGCAARLFHPKKCAPRCRLARIAITKLEQRLLEE